jgi:hypothetical protein
MELMLCKNCGIGNDHWKYQWSPGSWVVRKTGDGTSTSLCPDCAREEFRTLMECAALRKTGALAASAYRRGLVSAKFALALRNALQHLESVVNNQVVSQ